MKTAKEEVRELLDQLPEDSSLEDIQYHIYVRQMVQKGLKAAGEGKVIRFGMKSFEPVIAITGGAKLVNRIK